MQESHSNCVLTKKVKRESKKRLRIKIYIFVYQRSQLPGNDVNFRIFLYFGNVTIEEKENNERINFGNDHVVDMRRRKDAMKFPRNFNFNASYMATFSFFQQHSVRQLFKKKSFLFVFSYRMIKKQHRGLI